MPQFDAGSVVEPLECKLKPYTDFDDAIPEPSDKQVGVFLRGLREIMADARELSGADLTAGTDPNEVVKALDVLDPEKFVEITSRWAALYADLCSGRPSKAQILAVPLRRRQLFYAWLQEEVLSPEAGPGAGNGQAPRLPLRAAG